MKPEIKIIKDFLKSLGVEKYIKVHASYDTTVILEQSLINFNKEIYILPFEKKIGCLVYKILLEKGFDFSGIRFGTFAILHEIGHILVIKKYPNADDEHTTYSSQVREIMLAGKVDEKNGKSFWEIQENIVRKYRNLKLEADADSMAYELYTSFPNEVMVLDKAMLKFINGEKQKLKKLKN